LKSNEVKEIEVFFLQASLGTGAVLSISGEETSMAEIFINQAANGNHFC
jgi:hypothetical protein